MSGEMLVGWVLCSLHPAVGPLVHFYHSNRQLSQPTPQPTPSCPCCSTRTPSPPQAGTIGGVGAGACGIASVACA